MRNVDWKLIVILATLAVWSLGCVTSDDAVAEFKKYVAEDLAPGERVVNVRCKYDWSDEEFECKGQVTRKGSKEKKIVKGECEQELFWAVCEYD